MKLGEYATIDEYWVDINAGLREKPRTPFPRKRYLEQFVAKSSNGLFVARSIFANNNLTSIRVNNRTEVSNSNKATKLDFTERRIEGSWVRFGHLIITGSDIVGATTTKIEMTSEIPEEHQSQIDLGVDLILSID